jgi:hypothetical protein
MRPTAVVSELKKFDDALHTKARRNMETAGPSDEAPVPADHQAPWPELDPIVLHGVVGDFVRLIDPYSEADPIALLVQFFAFLGNVIGRSPYFQVESTRHYLNIFVLIVGITSKGRKGTSLDHVLGIFSRLDDHYTHNCIYAGLSSGEGLIYHVRDAKEEKQPIKEKGRIVDYQIVITDHGVEDKRTQIIETEFAAVVSRMGRDGSTLSACLRQAWETGNLRVMTKNNSLKATGAHVSIIAHVTRDELIRNLDQTDRANGFANRFLFACVRRSKCLPLGGSVPVFSINEIVRETQKAIDFGRGVGRMEFDDAARSLWFEVYPALSAGHPGMLGAVTSRAEAYVLRLGCMYAVLDCSSVVQLAHLKAALALWQYCEDSARYIFGDAVGDRLSDEILAALRECAEVGMTRTQLRDLFKRNVDADRMVGALRCLAENGLAYSRKEASEGRPIERWFASPRIAATPYVLDSQSLIKANNGKENVFSIPPSASDEEAAHICAQFQEGQ